MSMSKLFEKYSALQLEDLKLLGKDLERDTK
jgi:hypothetical protein